MPNRRRYSLRSSLFLLVAVCVTPAMLIAAALIYQQYQTKIDQVEHNTLLVARKTLSDVDRELTAIESALKVLATSSDLKSGDLASFHTRARNALASGIVYNYLLTDRAGRQVLNTLVPYGHPLPATGTPGELARVFTGARSVLTNLFIGPVTDKPTLAMGVPVIVDEEVAYSLNIGLSPAKINDILNRQQLPEGWIAAVIDGSATIVGRSRDSERFVGQKPVPELVAAIAKRPEGRLEALTKEGIPVFTAFSTSGNWGWTVAIGAPKEHLTEDLKKTIGMVLGGTLLTITFGTWFALLIARRVLSAVRDLNEAALNMVHNEPVRLPDILLKEADAVGDAIVKAAQVMNDTRFEAQHDPLTGLPNRRLFDQLASHQLALAERNMLGLALMAIDLDGFKQVNDQQGHAVGDTVLQQVAVRLGDVVRESDIAARLGGDEFVILLCEVEMEALSRMAERVLAALSEPYPGVHSPVSASIGIAIYPGHGESLATLMAQADSALYRAKGQGKRCVVIAEAPDGE